MCTPTLPEIPDVGGKRKCGHIRIEAPGSPVKDVERLSDQISSPVALA
jgi:hypothetical protein